MLTPSKEDWERIREHFSDEKAPDDSPGRKPIPTRRALEAILRISNAGAQWHMFPQRYPNYKTVHCRFQNWRCQDLLRNVPTDLANTLDDAGSIDESSS